MTSQPMTSLTEFLNSCQIDTDLKLLISDIAGSCTSISDAVRRGALDNILGSAGTGNVQGETQQKLDIFANDLLLKSNEGTGRLAAMASEENETIYPTQYSSGKYLLLFDPLDGSSNIDVNVSIGTIFSILEKTSTSQVTEQDFLQVGSKQVAAGYVLYGPQTILVLTTGSGVNMFTLDQANLQFLLTNTKFKYRQIRKNVQLICQTCATGHLQLADMLTSV